MRKLLLLFFCFLLCGCYPITVSDPVQNYHFTEVIVYEDSEFRISVTDLRYNRDSVEIKIFAENNSKSNVTVSCSHFIINGVMIDTFMYLKVATESKANGTIYLNRDNFLAAGIQELTSIESYGAHISMESGETRDIDFSIYNNSDYLQSIDEDGTILYEENGITVISKFKPGQYRNIIPLLIKNESGQDIHVMTSYVTVNGYTIPEVHYYRPICNGTYRFFNIELSSWGLEENKIGAIESASFYIDFLRPNSSEIIFQTDKLTA